MFKDIDLMIQKAYQQKYAVPHFNINNLEWAKYILEACEDLSSPVILGVSESAIKYMGGYETVGSLIKSLVSDLELTIPVGLLLDHGSDFKSCKKAIDGGFNGVMISADHVSITDNIKLTKEVVEYAHSNGVYVEGEIGDIGSANIDSELANVQDAITLVKETGIDSLAPSLGSIHGFYMKEVSLDFAKMETINNNAHIPLVLHGGSGIPDHMIIKAIENGVAKINTNTDFQVAWSNAVRKFLANDSKVYDPRKIISSGESAIKEVAKTKIMLLGSNYKA